MQDLLSVLSPNPTTSYTIGLVTAVQTGGTLTLSWQGGVAAKVPHLLSYAPVVGDKVQLLSSEAVGILVLGKTTVATPPPAPVNRTAWLTPNRSMTWAVETETDIGTVTEGVVTQGSDLVNVYSGAYVYPTGQVALKASEIIIKAELLIARVDPMTQHPMTAAPVLHELYSFDSNGAPRVPNPERDFIPTDMYPGEYLWHPIPVLWAAHLLTGDAIGFTFAPTSAQTALTYTQYADFTTVVDPFTGGVGGKVRLTIENDVASDPGWNPNLRSGIGFILQNHTFTVSGSGSLSNSKSGTSLILVSHFLTADGGKINQQLFGTGVISQLHVVTSTSRRMSLGTSEIFQSNTVTSTGTRLFNTFVLITQSNAITSTGIKNANGTGAVSQTNLVRAVNPTNRSGIGIITQTHTLVAVSGKVASGTSIISQTHTLTSTGNELAIGTSLITQSHAVTSTGNKSAIGAGVITQTDLWTSEGLRANTPATLVASSLMGVTSAGLNKTSSTFDVQAGDLITVFGLTSDLSMTMTAPTFTGSGTVTAQPLATTVGVTDRCNVYCWTIAVTASATARTISSTASADGPYWGARLNVWRGHGGVGAKAAGNAAGSAPSTNITTTSSANSRIDLAILDWAAVDGATRTWRTVNGSPITETYYFREAAQYTVYTGNVASAGSPGAKTLGLTAPAGQIWVLGAIEILPTEGVAPVQNSSGTGAISQSHTLTCTSGRVVSTLINQSFTGTNGAAPGNLMLGYTPTGGSALIQSNRVDFVTGTAGGYSGPAHVSRVFTVNGTTALSVANIDMQFTFVPGTGENFPGVFFRADTLAWSDGANGYALDFGATTGSLALFKMVGYAPATLATAAMPMTAGTAYQIRVKATGTSLQVWAGTTLPGTPNISITDSTFTAAGYAGITLRVGSAATAYHAYVDDLTVQ